MCYDPDLTAIERVYTRIFGVPINGLRIRLRRVLPKVGGNYGAISCAPMAALSTWGEKTLK